MALDSRLGPVASHAAALARNVPHAPLPLFEHSTPPSVAFVIPFLLQVSGC